MTSAHTSIIPEFVDKIDLMMSLGRLISWKALHALLTSAMIILITYFCSKLTFTLGQILMYCCVLASRPPLMLLYMDWNACLNTKEGGKPLLFVPKASCLMRAKNGHLVAITCHWVLSIKLGSSSNTSSTVVLVKNGRKILSTLSYSFWTNASMCFGWTEAATQYIILPLPLVLPGQATT